MTYTITLPNVTREGAAAVEQQLRGINEIDYVTIDQSTETATVTTNLSYGEVRDLIQQVGVAAN
ncbi:hypothetical protein ACIP5Y_24585 [Nocardia sp. NPDC088792]|uniref:hypothetical protein n=1 Tax=Nocardia sp. NPDC088792 TaxID=3364332 RepID=UPI0038095934